MPDEIDPKEIQETLAANKRALDAGTMSQADYNKSLEGLKTNSQKLSDNLKSLGTSAVQLAGALKEGDTRAQAYNGVVKSGTDMLANAATRLNPALGLLVKGVGMYAQAVNKQADAMYKGYQEISRLGATGSGGLTDVYNSMKKLGYGVNDLAEMQGLLADSATTLASLSGTVADGTANIANVSRQIRDSDIGNKFLTMGISVDGMNKGIVSYLKIQTQVGQAQRMTADQLSAGAAMYIESADKLTKITGMSLQQQQAADQAALSEDRFGAWADMEARKGEQGQRNVDEMLKINKILQAQGPGGAAVAKGLKDLKSGDVTTEEARKLSLSNPEILRVLSKKNVDADDILDSLGRGADQLTKSMNANMAVGATKGFQSRAEIQAIIQARAGGQSIAEREAAATIGQDITDKPTKNLTGIATSARETRDNLQDMVQRGIQPVTAAMEGLAKITATATGIPNKALGSSGGGHYIGKDGPGILTGSPGKSTPTTGTSKEYYDKMYNKLLDEGKKQGIANPEAVARLGAAQTSLETGYGKHMVGNNAFGIKARGGQGGVGAQTQEYVNGKMVTMNQQFRSYKSPEESASDYIAFLKENPRYRDVLASKSAAEAISAQGRTGYATDPNYASKLASINASNAGPSSGRQGVQLPDATQTVGSKRDDSDLRSAKAIAEDERQAEFKRAQLEKLQESNDIARRTERNTKKTSTALK